NRWTRPPSSSFQWASAARHLSMIRRFEERAHARRAFGDKCRLAAGTSGDDDLLPRSTVAQEQPGHGSEEYRRDEKRQRHGDDSHPDGGSSEDRLAIHDELLAVA